MNLSSPVEIKLVPSLAAPKPILAIKMIVLKIITIHLCANDQRSIRLYPLPTRPNVSSLCCLTPFLKKVALKEGTMVIETSKEASKLNAIANANGLNISPTDPLTNANGRKTIIVTIVDDIIGLNTSLVALIMRLLPVSVSFLSDKRL